MYPNNDYRDYLMHHGILGQRWGIRRYQPYSTTGPRKGGKTGKEIGEAAGSRKERRIIKKADRYVDAFNKDYNKTMDKRLEVRDKITKKYDKKINKLKEKQKNNPKKDRSDTIKELTNEKKSQLQQHKNFDKYIKAGYSSCIKTVADNANVKLKAINDKQYKHTEKYKEARRAYKGMKRMQAMNYGNISVVALRSVFQQYRSHNS